MSKQCQTLVKLAHKIDMLSTPSYVNPYGGTMSKRANKLKFLSKLLGTGAKKVSPLVRQTTHTDDITKQILSRQGSKSMHNAADVGQAVGKGDGFRNWFSNRLINTRYGRNLLGSGPKVTLNRGADGSRVLKSQTQSATQASGRKMPVNKLNQPLQRTVPNSRQRVFNSGKDGLEESVNTLTKNPSPTIQSSKQQVLHSGSGGSSNAFLNKHFPTFTNWGTGAKNLAGDVRQGFSLLPKELRYNVNAGKTQGTYKALSPKTWRASPLENASLLRSSKLPGVNHLDKIPAGIRKPLGLTATAGTMGFMAPESMGGGGGWGWTGLGFPTSLMLDNVENKRNIDELTTTNAGLAGNQYNSFSPDDISEIVSNPEKYYPLIDGEYGTNLSQNLPSFNQGAKPAPANVTPPDGGSIPGMAMSVAGGGAAGLVVAQLVHKYKVKRYAEENGITEEQAAEKLGGPSRLIPGLAGAALGSGLNLYKHRR